MVQPFTLKQLSAGGVTSALEKAQHYRLLNEPQEAESICLDVLAVTDADSATHAQARITLILALSDQLEEDMGCFELALNLIGELHGYERIYYEGLLCERRAKAHHRRGGLFAGSVAYDWFRRAMDCFEAAAKAPGRPQGNEDAVLRWNTCARLLMRHADLSPDLDREDRSEPLLE